jgi:hypothetical protein
VGLPPWTAGDQRAAGDGRRRLGVNEKRAAVVVVDLFDPTRVVND